MIKKILNYDTYQLISKLSIFKIHNFILLVLSYFFSKITGNMVHWGLPVSIAIEPTTACNLRCPECPSGLRNFSRPTGNLKANFFNSIISQISKHTYYLIFYFQGEPYINPSFLEMVKEASSKGIYTATSTNGHFLSKENSIKTVDSGLNRLIISIDGTTQDTYSSYRIEGSLEKVIEGTKNIVEAKKQLNSKSPYLIFQYLVVKPNEHQINDAKKLAKDLGVDEIRFKTAQIYDFEKGSDLIPDNPKYSRYKKDRFGKFIIDNPLFNHCWRLWHSPVITWDGNVVPCCFDKDATHRLGNLNEQSFKEVWRSDRYNKFRSSVLRSRKEIDICANCSEGTKVWA